MLGNRERLLRGTSGTVSRSIKSMAAAFSEHLAHDEEFLLGNKRQQEIQVGMLLDIKIIQARFFRFRSGVARISTLQQHA